MPALPFNGYYLTLASLLACTAIGIVVAARFRREVEEDSRPTTAKDLLDPLEKAYYSGLMHPAEIERVRETVKKKREVAADPARPTPRRPTPADPDSTSPPAGPPDPAGEGSELPPETPAPGGG